MKNKITVLYCITLLIVLLATQCTVMNRRYTKGIYVSQLSKKNSAKFPARENTVVRHTEEKQDITPIAKARMVTNRAPDHESHITASVKQIPRRGLAPKNPRLPPDSCLDMVTFMSGEELRIKLEEITPDYIAYRRCDYLTGPLIKTATSKIFRIKYGNGTVRVFRHEEPPATYNNTAHVNDNRKPVEKRTNGWAVASFVTSLFWFFILPAVLGLIFGIVSVNQFDAEPEKYKGKWMAVVGITISSIAIALILLIVLANL